MEKKENKLGFEPPTSCTLGAGVTATPCLFNNNSCHTYRCYLIIQVEGCVFKGRGVEVNKPLFLIVKYS